MFSQTTEYALRAMTWLARTPGEVVRTVELAQHAKVPQHYLAKVLQQLAAARLVAGRRGVKGGYRLARPPGEIRVIDVIRAVEKFAGISTCPLHDDAAPGALCALHRLMHLAFERTEELLAGHTLADLVNTGGRPFCERVGRGEGGSPKRPK